MLTSSQYIKTTSLKIENKIKNYTYDNITKIIFLKINDGSTIPTVKLENNKFRNNEF